MQNKDKQAIWDEVLKDCCKCYPDAVGNSPCDNGCLCDKCSADWVQQEYIRRMNEEV
jgi:hypothetical protein